jgi:hypothetical protein
LNVRKHLLRGQVIPAHPLALTAQRRLDERRQRALTRYYVAAGAGGVAVGVHTTQFAIRDPHVALYGPVLELAAQTARESLASSPRPFALIAGAVGTTTNAVAEAETAARLGYDAVLLSLGAWQNAAELKILDHCRAVAGVLPLFGFYLQPAVGGRVLSYAFWREFAEIENVWAIKVAPFDRYKTLDVVRAVAAAARDDIALYTGNDDSIVVDLLTSFPAESSGRETTRQIVGGLLGQWAVWTRGAVRLLDRVRAARSSATIDAHWLGLAAALTDANGAIFDAANAFVGCIPGIHEILRRQGLLCGTWCLEPRETLSPGQAEELDRVSRRYPFLAAEDDELVRDNLDAWLR